MTKEDFKNKRGVVAVPISLLYDRFNYSIQYVGYLENEWTVPCKLTEKRAEIFLADKSVTKVRIMDEVGNVLAELDLV